jgi:hypothetical protein
MEILRQKISFIIAILFLLSSCAWYIFILNGFINHYVTDEAMTRESVRSAAVLRQELLKESGS